MRIIKAGVMDDIDVINNSKPGAELFAPERIKWVSAVDGANQVDAVSAPSRGLGRPGPRLLTLWCSDAILGLRLCDIACNASKYASDACMKVCLGHC
jgi:hypothetical protein